MVEALRKAGGAGPGKEADLALLKLGEVDGEEYFGRHGERWECAMEVWEAEGESKWWAERWEALKGEETEKAASMLGVLARMKEMNAGELGEVDRDKMWAVYRKFGGLKKPEELKKVQCYDNLARVAVPDNFSLETREGASSAIKWASRGERLRGARRRCYINNSSFLPRFAPRFAPR